MTVISVQTLLQSALPPGPQGPSGPQGSPGPVAGSNTQIIFNDSNVANGSANLTFDKSTNLLTVNGNITANTNGFAIGYRDIPQVAFTGNATLAIADAGKHFYSTLSTANTLTLPNNSSVTFSTGTAINIINQGTGNITLTRGSGVTLYLTGNTTSADRVVTSYGMATVIKVATDTWFVSGAGVI